MSLTKFSKNSCILLTFVGLLFCFKPMALGQNHILFKEPPAQLDISQIRPRVIIQDSHGFIWVGTVDGLMRYDGYDNRIYRSNLKDSTSIAESQIKWIAEDETGIFWIVNMNGTLNRFNPVTETFQTVKLTETNRSNPHVLNRLVVKDGQLWLKMESGLLFHTSVDSPNLTNQVAEKVRDIIKGEEKVWISTQNGLKYWDVAKQNLVTPSFQKEKAPALIDGAIGDLRTDKLGNLWTIVKTHLYQVNTSTFQVQRFPLADKLPFLNTPYHEYKFIVDDQYRLWIWAFGAGSILTAYDLRTQEVQRYPPSEENGLRSDAIRDALIDKDGLFWAATNTGVSYTKTEPSPFHVWKHRPNATNTISSNKIRRIIEDKTGNIWIATNGGGVNKYDVKTNKFTTYRHNPKQNSICSDKINRLMEDKNGWLWIGSSSKGLSKFNPQTQQFIHYKHDPNQPNSLNNNTVRALYEDKFGNIWVGTRLGINLYQPETDDFIDYVPNDRGRDISVMSILMDKDDRLWLTTYGSGLYQFDIQSKQFKVYRKNPDNPKSFSHNNALALCEDQQKRLWISTSAGLNLYHPETDDFTSYTKADGFLNEYIVGMEEDQSGNLWLSTFNGLIKFNPDQLTVRNYTISDGLPSNRFGNSGYGKSKQTGQLFFGGLDGVVYFHPDSLTEDSTFKSLVFSNMEIIKAETGQSINIPGIDYKKEITLNHTENTFTVDFSYLEFDKSNSVQYAYQLKNKQDNWVNLSNNRRLTFSNLNPGDYTLKIKAANNAGIWTPEEKILNITINPPWWQTNLAYFSYLFLLLIATYWLYNLLLNRKIAQSRYQQLSELDAFKTQFYTNITHEFRTPLTIISGMAEKIKQEPKTWSKSGVEMIRRNSYNLLRLVNQLLDLQKLESGKLRLNLQQGEIISYLKYLLESFQSFAEGQGIKTHFLTKTAELWMDFDSDKMTSIISNLLSNAIKFSKKNGDIYLQIEKIKSLQDTELLSISIKDVGIGIPSDKLPHIFDRFYQVDSSNTREGEGTGVGLALTKELVRLMGGTIKVESKIGQGTTFSVLLPIRQQTVKQITKSTTAQTWGWETTPTTKQVAAAINLNKVANDRPIILIIEDNLDVQYYLTACLKNKYQLIYAENGAIGIEKAIAEIPDLIISDVMMPEKDGLEVCKTLKNKITTSHIPIVLLTAKAAFADKIAGLEFGADAYLSKPFHPDELLVRLHKLIELRQKLQAKYSSGSFIQNPSPKTEDIFLRELQKIILDNLNTMNFGPNELAKAMNVSRSQLHRKLKALTDISTSNYINKIRLQEAKKLLRETNKSISEIAYQVGFSSPPYFSTSFSAAFSCTPSDYREQG